MTTVDLYDSVIKECGTVPFQSCYMMKRENDVVSVLQLYFISYLFVHFIIFHNTFVRFPKAGRKGANISSNIGKHRCWMKMLDWSWPLMSYIPR